MEIRELKEKIKSSIKEDNLKQAFDLFFDFLKSDNSANDELYEDILLTNANFQRIEKAYTKDLIDWETMSRKKSNVGQALLTFVEKVKNYEDNKQGTVFFLRKADNKVSANLKTTQVDEIEFVSNETIPSDSLVDFPDRIIIEFTKECAKLSTDETLILKRIINTNLKKYLYSNSVISQPVSGKKHGELKGQRDRFENIENSTIVNRSLVRLAKDDIFSSIESLDEELIYLEEK